MKKASVLFFQGQYRWLSNFYLASLVVNGIEYPSSEHAYQALKTKDQKLRKKFSETAIYFVKSLGRSVSLRDGWDTRNLKVKAMWKVTCKKYEQNPELLQKLLELQDYYLEEGNTWNDKYWGTVKGAGQNMLGQILMAYRDMRLGFINRKVHPLIQELAKKSIKRFT